MIGRAALPGAIVLRVPDPLLALQQLGALARFSRNRHKSSASRGPMARPPSRSGPTLCRSHTAVSRSPGSWNSQVGVPLSLWSLDDEADVHLVEAGISQPGEMAALARIIRPDIGVMVHFGDAHDAHFPDRATKSPRKTPPVRRRQPHRHGHARCRLIAAIEEREWLDRCAFWSLDGPKDAGSPVASDLRVQSKIDLQCTLSGHWKDTPVEWTVPFTDRTSVSNALTTALLALELGLGTGNGSGRPSAPSAPQACA